jgi:SNF2 family DNA or RNA helicase
MGFSALEEEPKGASEIASPSALEAQTTTPQPPIAEVRSSAMKVLSPHSKFNLQDIDPPWCQRLLDQLGQSSFDDISTVSTQPILISPEKTKPFTDLLAQLRKLANGNGLLPAGIQFKERHVKAMLELVRGGKSLKEAAEIIVRSKFQCGTLSPTLAQKLSNLGRLDLGSINLEWCVWILSQLKQEKFETVDPDSSEPVTFIPGKAKPLKLLLEDVGALIKNAGLLPEGIVLDGCQTLAILHRVHGGKSIQEVMETTLVPPPEKNPNPTPVPIPEGLRTEFENQFRFGLNTLSQQWCQWILDQMGKKSFSELSPSCRDTVCIFPGENWRLTSLLQHIKNLATTENLLAEGMKFEVSNAKIILQNIHEGKSLKEAIDLTNLSVEQGKQAERAAEAETKLKEEFETYAKDLFSGKAPDSELIKQLLLKFGTENCLSVIIAYHPEYQGLPVDYLQKIIGEYIGDFLKNNTPGVHEDDIELPDFLFPEWIDSVFTRLKQEAFNYYTKKRREGSSTTDMDLILEFLDTQEQFLTSHVQLEPLMDRALSYYGDLFALKKPARMADQLKKGRQFPDINQLINIKELKEHGRLLIADEMGLGKSCSAIAAKEILGLKKALVLAPSAVVDTWKDYLSSNKNEKGEPIGYFKEGQAPKVLVIDKSSDLTEESLKKDYDYILISHEKINSENVNTLIEHCDFDYLIADEVHKFKNLANGMRSEELLRLSDKLADKKGHLAILSGTPVPNKIQDLALILKLLYRDELKNGKDGKDYYTNGELVHLMIRGDLRKLQINLHERMQMKKMASCIELPKKTVQEIFVEMSDKERQIYELLLEVDEILAPEKIRLLKTYTLNPLALESTYHMGEKPSKIKVLEKILTEAMSQATFEGEKLTGGRVVVYINDIIDGVLTNDKKSCPTVLDQITLPEGVEKRVIHAGASRKERVEIQKELNEGNQKMVLFVSGQIAGVGISFVGADTLIHYNDPWTLDDKDQQVARVHRFGLEHPIIAITLTTKGTIEQVQQEYMQRKRKIILKLFQNQPLSKSDRAFLEKDAALDDDSKIAETDPEMVREWDSFKNKYAKLLGSCKGAGEKLFTKYLKEHPGEYSAIYELMGSRSYHSNNTRVASTLLESMIQERSQEKQSLQILDMASGPKTLERHSLPELASRVTSLDINPDHFKGANMDRVLIGSYLDTSIQSGTLDYCVLGLAFDYTRYAPTNKKIDGRFERIQLLAEMNRILKIGGRAVISTSFSTTMKNSAFFEKAATALGFKLVEGYCGRVEAGTVFQANYITLEKVKSVECAGDRIGLDTLLPNFDEEAFEGLKFRTKGDKTKGVEKMTAEERKEEKEKDEKYQKHLKMIDRVELNGKTFAIQFNETDQKVKDEEDQFFATIEQLKREHHCTDSKDIPRPAIVSAGLDGIEFKKGNYRIFKPLEATKGFLIDR